MRVPKLPEGGWLGSSVGPFRRYQLEAVLCCTWKKGKGFAADPGFVSLPVEGGQWMSALASRHVEIAFGFPPRGNGESLGRSTENSLSSGNIDVSGKTHHGEVEPAPQKRR